MASRLLYVVNDAGFFLSHRLPIALAARDAGYDVAIACPADDKSSKIIAAGLRHIELPLPRGGLGPLGELRAILALDRLFASFKPDLAHLITSKPIIYAGLVSRRRGIPAVAAVSGLGHVFIDGGLKAKMLRPLALLGYRLAMGRKGLFPIFQNRDNLALFRDAGALREEPTLIRGSGTDLAMFDPEPADNLVPRLVLPARMLFAKGVAEFVEAARILRARGIKAEFVLVGDPDPANPASIPQKQLEAWNADGVIRWEGYRADIDAVLKDSDIVVLPSHNEGFPKTLVDAAAAGRAVVTNDVTGCRDAVIPDETALLAAAHDAADLADTMQRLIEDRDLRLSMGRAGRALAQEHYAIERIVQQHLDLYRKALDQPPAHPLADAPSPLPSPAPSQAS